MGEEEIGSTHAGAVSEVVFARGDDGGQPLTLEQVLRFAACDALNAAATLRKMARSVKGADAIGRLDLEDLRNLLQAPHRLVTALMDLSAAGEGLEQSLREGVYRSMAEQLKADERSARASLYGEAMEES